MTTKPRKRPSRNTGTWSASRRVTMASLNVANVTPAAKRQEFRTPDDEQRHAQALEEWGRWKLRTAGIA